MQVDQHPGGGARIMLAAGGAIDPFWAMYAQHQTAEVRKLLETYRIGDLVRHCCLPDTCLHLLTLPIICLQQKAAQNLLGMRSACQRLHPAGALVMKAGDETLRQKQSP